jgi:hypothetical protein
MRLLLVESLVEENYSESPAVFGGCSALVR